MPLSSKELKLAATMLFSECWRNVKVLKLTENLRIKKHGGDYNWSEYLLSIGEDNFDKQCINGIEYNKIPSSMVIKSGKIADLVDAVYPNLSTNYKDKGWRYNRAIICPKNDDVAEINKIVLDLLPGKEEKFYSIDQVNDHDAFHEKSNGENNT